MKNTFAPLVMALLGALLVVPACGSDRPLTALRDGPRECVELERNCQAPAAALGEPYAKCYETGKSKVSNACINYYYDCIDQCRTASENLGAAGQGGEGGAGPQGTAGEAGAVAGAGGA